MAVKRIEKQKIFLYAVVLVVAALAIYSAYSWYQSTFFGANYQKALQSQTANICATPPGYTDEQWRTHMSHHPDIYKSCFNQ